MEVTKVKWGILNFIVLVHPFTPSEPLLVLLFASWAFIKLIDPPVSRLSWVTIPLLVVLAIGIASGLRNGIGKDLIRDIWFYGKPVLVIVLAADLARGLVVSEYQIIRLIVLGALVSSLVHFVEIITVPGFYNKSLYNIRDNYTRLSSWVEAVAAALFVYDLAVKRIISLPRVLKYPIMGIVLLSYALFVSRTMLLVSFIMLMYFLNLMRPSFASVLTFLLILLAGYLVFSIDPASMANGSALQTFVEKIQKSPYELVLPDMDLNKKQINDYWRGYEAQRAIMQTVANGPGAVVYGNGFGSLVDLGLTMKLDGEEFRQVPKIHNGFAALFFKTGILGILAYLVTYLVFFIAIVQRTRLYRGFLPLLAKGVLLNAFLATATITGIYNQHTLDAMLLISFFSLVVYHPEMLAEGEAELPIEETRLEARPANT